MGKNKMTLKEAKIEYNPRKIFDILINDKPYTVYDIDGYEHEYGKWNGCPTTWWLDYSEYEEYVDEIGDIEEGDIRELVPYIDKGVHRICWEINYKQFNRTKYKWGEWDVRNGGICKMYANGKPVYEFYSRDIGHALSKAQSLEVTLLEHPFDFIDQKSENGRKIWYYGLPAKIRCGYNPGEIGIVPDYSYMEEEDWWRELKNRKSKINPKGYQKNNDDILDSEESEEDRHQSWINHGDALWDGMINWFRS